MYAISRKKICYKNKIINKSKNFVNKKFRQIAHFLPIALKVLTREPLQDATKHLASKTLALEHSNKLP